MKPSLKKLPALAALMVALALAMWMTGRSTPSTSARTGIAATGPATDSGPQALRPAPAPHAWQERQAFEARARAFLRNAATLGAVQRTEQARALSASIDRYEREGGLSAGESLLLRTGLIKATVAGESEQAEQIAELMDRYRQHADQRMDAYARQHAADARFQDYKARERAIVAEVMALREIPGGLTRDDYLRQRLQQARETSYR